MKFIHLSDLHLVTPGTTLHGRDPQDRLRRCIAHIRAFHADAAFVVPTGDLTQGGEPAGYEAARAILAELPMPSTSRSATTTAGTHSAPPSLM